LQPSANEKNQLENAIIIRFNKSVLRTRRGSCEWIRPNGNWKSSSTLHDEQEDKEEEEEEKAIDSSA